MTDFALNDYPISNSAIIIVDPYNDFLSKKGKAWPLVKSTVSKNQVIAHIMQLLTVSRELGMLVTYAPHQRYNKDSYQDRTFLHSAQAQQIATKHLSAKE